MKPYYEEAGIVIYHGDCLGIIPALPKVDLVLTDPPYGIGAARKEFGGNGVKRHLTGLLAGKCVKKRDYGDSEWDDRPVNADLLQAVIAMGEYQIIWGGNYFDLGPAKCILVWDKLRGDTDYADGEIAWTNLNKSLRIIRWKWNGFLQQNSGEDKEDRWHPTQKPFSVMAWCLKQPPPRFENSTGPVYG